MKEKNENLRNKQDDSLASTEKPQKGGKQNTAAGQRDATDMNEKKISRTSPTERGAGTATKRNVTGSDYDGQAV